MTFFLISGSKNACIFNLTYGTDLYLFTRDMMIKQLCMHYLFVLYRFGGAEFPPIIMFKIFIHSGGQGVKYYCGKKVIKPASEVIKTVIKTVIRVKLILLQLHLDKEY